MTTASERPAQLSRMQEARRQIQRQLDMIDRQIIRRMTALISQLSNKHAGYWRGKAPDPGAFLERYRSNLAAITAERQPEIDALSRKLARQDAAIVAFCASHGLSASRVGQPPAIAGGACNRTGAARRSLDNTEGHHG